MEMEASFTWTGQTKWENEAKENLFWRRTSAILRDGAGGALVWWISGDSIRLARVHADGRAPQVGRPVRLGTSIDPGFAPFVAELSGRRYVMVWTERRDNAWRVLAQEFVSGDGGPATRGNPLVLAADSPETPRWTAWVRTGDDSAILALSLLTGGGRSVSLRLGRLTWR
jgi:hypothetical protein